MKIHRTGPTPPSPTGPSGAAAACDSRTCSTAARPAHSTASPLTPLAQNRAPQLRPARSPLRRALPAGRSAGAHVADDPCRPDGEEFDRTLPTSLAATLFELPSATSALLHLDLKQRPDPLAFHLIETLDAKLRNR